MPDEPTIKLKPSRDPSRVSIRVGGKSVGTISRTRAEAMGLSNGDEWTDGLAARVADAVAIDKAQRYALNALARRPMSEGQMRERLKRREFSVAVADEIVAALVERGLIDDESFGRHAIEAERRRKAAGGRLLRYKLMQKKLPRDLVDRLVDEAEAGYDAVDEARALAEKKLATMAMRKLDPAGRKRRLWGLLARRGFGPDVIRSALDPLAGLGDEWQ